MALLSQTSSPYTSESGLKKKKFSCPEPGCGKSFSRSEHLHRHKLNHIEGNYTCNRCATHFKRRDLLDRHVQRHKEKDAEAGGEGLGYLATRKRLWRNSDGRIVNSKRPYIDNAKNTELKDENAGQSRNTANSAPPSPPTSNPSTSSAHNAEQRPDDGLLEQPWPPLDMNLMPSGNGTDPDFFSNSSWGSHSFYAFMGEASDIPMDDAFDPDTTISFNAPLTTMNYYSWLFSNEAAAAVHNPLQLHAPPLPIHTSGYVADFANISNASNQAASIGTNSSAHLQMQLQPELAHSQQTEFSAPQTDNLSQLQFGSHGGERRNIDGTGFISPTSSLSSPQHDNLSTSISQPSSSSTTPPSLATNSSPLSLPDSYIRKTPLRLPIITNESRDGVMELISRSRPVKPDGSEISSCDPLLSLSALQHYSDLFFTRFNATYPLIHQATFQSSKTHPFLITAILLMGATYSDKEAHLLAICIHDIMRPILHGSKEFGIRPKLWMLQTIVLVECFGKSRAGEKQHDLSHLYHGLQINLIRRSDCQNASIEPWDEKTQTLEEYWHLAIEVEQKRRLAMIAFMWDTQHAMLFSQVLCMNAAELRVTLPWDTAIWEADTAEEWLRLTRASPPSPRWMTVLKSYTDLSAPMPPLTVNALSRALVFHGLMSIAWDLKRRDQTNLSSATAAQSIGGWQPRISASYDKWKADFDVYTKSVLSSLSFYPNHQAKFQRYAIANSAVFHTAQVILEVEIADLQIYTGATHILGRAATDTDRQRARIRMEEWMSRDQGASAGRATWHAARLFRDGIVKLENWNVDEMIHYPWCLYLSTLMCWTLHSAAIENSADTVQKSLLSTTQLSHGESDEDSDWDSTAEMNALISALTRLDPAADTFVKDIWIVAGKYRAAGLVKCIIKQLNSVRWAVVREGMKVLQSLPKIS